MISAATLRSIAEAARNAGCTITMEPLGLNIQKTPDGAQYMLTWVELETLRFPLAHLTREMHSL